MFALAPVHDLARICSFSTVNNVNTHRRILNPRNTGAIRNSFSFLMLALFAYSHP